MGIKKKGFINRHKQLFFSYVFIAFLLSNITAFGQNNPLDIIISIKVKQANAKTLIEGIEKDYSINFSYSDNILDTLVLHTQSADNILLKDFLKNYLEPQGVGYKVIGSRIVLFAIKKPPQWFTISGYIKDAKTSEDIIGATIYISGLQVGTVTNSYGFYSIKLPKGNYKIHYRSMGYNDTIISVSLVYHKKANILLRQKSYSVNEITVNTHINSIFLESDLMNLVKVDIKSLQELPVLLGENDALRNLSVLPGIQSNELSTSSINVRGGGTDQTTFLMDEAILYNASHFGGFFSIFNPDVVNNVNIYKSDVPVSEGGALSSLIDVRLREGNNKKWQVKGGLGLISARLSVEGPLKKDKSSVLVAFRRTYVDVVMKLLSTDPNFKSMKFYFYDGNFKLNYKFNENNRLFLSGYAGTDKLSQYSNMVNSNYLGSVRWNHLFGHRLFTNTTISVSRNLMNQGTRDENEQLYWESIINNQKFKTDFSYYYSDVFKCTFGYSANIFNISPFSLLTKTEKTITTRYKSSLDQMLLNSLYYQQQITINKKLGIDAGLRFTYLLTEPFTDSLVGLSNSYVEPHLRISYAFNKNATVKGSFSQQVQPLHQLPLSTAGISINRWMPSNESFIPQKSMNYTIGYYNKNVWGVNFLSEVYYRKMENLIETMQDERILYTDDPESYLHKASGVAYGLEMLFSYKIKNVSAMLSYDYCKAIWETESLNYGNPYPASHTREHSLNITGVYHFNSRVSASAKWIFASGTPYTAATGKYKVDGKTYLQFNDGKVNTKKLPPYHRLDLSLDIAGKHNETRRWKSFWNFSVYNAYFRKNPLGIYYFIPDYENEVEVQGLNPGFYYLYQFVPSVSYRFEF